MNALQSMLDKPISSCNLVFVITAANLETGDKDWLINDLWNCKQAGFAVDVIDIALLPLEEIKSRMDWADVIMFGGGDTYYLLEWTEKSGLKKILPELLKSKVYAGISAGSMITAPNIRTTFVQLFDEDKPGVIEGLGIVDFNFRPHFGSEHFPRVNKENMDRIAKEIGEPIYVADDMTAVKVVDGKAEVVSEGKYLVYNLPAV